MRRREREITDGAELADVLSRGRVLHLALDSQDGPYVVPLSYGRGEGCLYFHSAPEGRKMDLIRAGGRCSFSVVAHEALQEADEACAWTAYYESVVGRGVAGIVRDDNEKRTGLAAIMNQYAPGEWAFSDAAVARTLVVRIVIEELTGKRNIKES